MLIIDLAAAASITALLAIAFHDFAAAYELL
jgi:hypothetical protein